MSMDLTVSEIERQNILNNPYALAEIEKATRIECFVFEGRAILLKEQIADFFQVTPRTIDNYIARFETELSRNGYEVLRGNRLKEFKKQIANQDVHETNFVNIKTPQLGVFDFRAFLNLAMLITESESARLLRIAILDVVIDTINRKTGGSTKYINQRDEDFIVTYFQEENYRKEFTDALKDYVDMGTFKYALYTDKIYITIFNEKAQEYRKVLRLQRNDKVRDTFYSEILDLVASFEYGFAVLIKEASQKSGNMLCSWEIDRLYLQFEKQPHWRPLIERARIKMASRDLAFRDA